MAFFSYSERFVGQVPLSVRICILDNLTELISVLESKMSDFLINHEVRNDELTINIKLETVVKCIEFLATDSDCLFTTLIDITAVDYPDRPQRFNVVYHLLSMAQNRRIRLKVNVKDGELVPSIVGVHSCANWFEREVFDMYGIYFSGHPDLRRLLTDYGFSGHPLRKDFPTTGYLEVRYDETKKQVVYEKTKLSQEYRQFDFLSPWEGVKNIKTETDNETDGNV